MDFEVVGCDALSHDSLYETSTKAEANKLCGLLVAVSDCDDDETDMNSNYEMKIACIGFVCIGTGHVLRPRLS